MLTAPANGRPGESGFTIVELMVTVAVLAVLMALAMPSMSAWVRNGKLRAIGDSLQTGLRQAQAESLRRNRQVVFTLTDNKTTAANFTAQAAVANGKFWSLATVAAYENDPVEFIESGVLSDIAEGVQITGPSAVCFNSIGRMVDNGSPGISGAICEAPSPDDGPQVKKFDLAFADAIEGQDRNFSVTVGLGGQVRMCDRDKTLSDTHPDGCP